MSAQIHEVQRLPLPWFNWISSSSLLAGPESEQAGHLVSAGSEGNWRWQEVVEYVPAPPPVPSVCELGGDIATRPPDSVACAASRLHEFVVRMLGENLPGLDLRLTFVEPGSGARRNYLRISTATIPLHLVFQSPPAGAGRERAVVEGLAVAGHEYFHALVATGDLKKFPDKLGEERAGHALERCAKLAIGGLGYAVEVVQGEMDSGNSPRSSTAALSWQASQEVDRLTAEALARHPGPTPADRAAATLVVCRSQLGLASS